MGEDVSVVEVIKGGDNVNRSPSSHMNNSAHGTWLGKGCPLLTGRQRIGWGGSTSISGGCARCGDRGLEVWNVVLAVLYIWLTGQHRIGWGGSTSISGIGRMCRAWRWRIGTWGCED